MEKAIQDFLQELIHQDQDNADRILGDVITDGDPSADDTDLPQIRSVSTFEEAGVLTMNKGVVLNLTDGSRAFLTIQVQ